MVDGNAQADAALKVINDLIHQKTGHSYSEDHLDRLKDKLEPLVAARGFDSFLDYYYLLKYGEDGEEEWQRVMSALAVNETYFWREFDQIRIAATVLVPKFQAQHPDRPVRIWHAGCATGEEPYTMAITLIEAGAYARGPIEIVATDFNLEAVEKARHGVFRPRSFRSFPEQVQQNYFSKLTDSKQELVQDVIRRVTFSYLNLMDEAGMRAMREFDLIFCRNVFIYFSTAAIRKVVNNFYESLSTPGYLCVAAAESLLRITTLYDLVEIGGAFFYMKG